MSGVPSEPVDDLDWALSSGQVSGINLAESLLSAYYIPVFRLELFLLQSPQAAGEATLKAFEAALETPYHAAVSPRSWLLDLARKAGLRRAKKARAVSLTESQPADRLERAFWQAFDALPLDDRLVIFAHHVLGLTIDELSEFLHLRQEQAAQRLATAQAYLQESHQGTGLSWSDTGAALAHHWPAPRLEQDEIHRLAVQVELQASRAKAGRQRSFSIKELVWIGLTILAVLVAGPFVSQSPLFIEPAPTATAVPVYTPPTPLPRTNVIYFVEDQDTLASIAARVAMPVEKLMALNNITSTASLYPGQWLWISIEDAPVSVVPSRPMAPPGPGEALTTTSSSQTIEKRIQASMSLWNTLWADIEFTPAELIKGKDPQTVYRYQVWVSQPALSLELIGSKGSPPFERFIGLNGRGYFSVSNSNIVYLDPTWHPGPQTLLQNQLLADLLFPGDSQWRRSGWSFKPVAAGTQAGRPALIVDWIDPQGRRSERLWLDTSLGLVLRRAIYAENDPEQPDSEISIQELALDVNLPAQLFNPQIPWQGGFKPGY